MISQILTLKQAQGLIPGLSWHEWKEIRPGSVVCREIEGEGWGIDWCIHVEDPDGKAITCSKSCDSQRHAERSAEIVSGILGVPIVRPSWWRS